MVSFIRLFLANLNVYRMIFIVTYVERKKERDADIDLSQ